MTTSTAAPALATQPQIDYIHVLVDTREVDPARAAELCERLAAGQVTKAQASAAITALKRLPKVGPKAGPAWSEVSLVDGTNPKNVTHSGSEQAPTTAPAPVAPAAPSQPYSGPLSAGIVAQDVEVLSLPFASVADGPVAAVAEALIAGDPAGEQQAFTFDEADEIKVEAKPEPGPVCEEGLYERGDYIFRVFTKDGVLVAKRLVGGSKWVPSHALKWLTTADRMSVERAEAISKKIHRCVRCLHHIWVDASVSAGMGPVCRGKV